MGWLYVDNLKTFQYSFVYFKPHYVLENCYEGLNPTVMG